MAVFIPKVLVLLCFVSVGICWPLVEDNYLDEGNSVDGDGVIDLSTLGPEAFREPDEKSGEALSNWTTTSEVNPEETGEYLEGDILMPRGSLRNGMRDQSYRWQDGIVPYVIEGYYSTEQRDLIMKAIADYHRLTCIRFVPYTGQTDYLVIQSKNTGCWSSVGRIGGRQEVNLQTPGCVSLKGTVLHELLHALGFMHEQSRPERDHFVTVHYRNIRIGGRQEVNLQTPGCVSLKGTVLHELLHELLHALGFMHEQSRPERDHFVTVHYRNIRIAELVSEDSGTPSNTNHDVALWWFHAALVAIAKTPGGRQEVTLQTPGCVSLKGTVLHELLHALGFMHEQSRPERDHFVTVHYRNIRIGAENNFKKADAKSTDDFGVGYDYNSVMHYSDKAFSKNGQITIEPKVGGVKVGQRDGFSRGDVRKLNNMYNCSKDLYSVSENPTKDGWDQFGKDFLETISSLVNKFV
ncbi:protein SpAN [Plutella xylostella]|uniref:protein SpAN n=1 Tax=Plutella xylostella TaxID=51655 RepID=UPI00203266F7|nr:protein SpAN [Plutella xylostella]